MTNEDLTPLPALPFLLGIILAVIVTAGSFQLTLSRYHLVRGGIWAMWAHYMPEISQEVHLSIRRSLRWDNLDPEAWSDLAKLEYALSAKAPVRRAWAAWAADRAHRLEPYRKTYAKLIKIIKKNDSIP
ncbi:MAG: hypothetical protein HY747_04145 [Elusimicrobia bacterium]|nr:hypothetical protein [Elusimicrobiota bacterium]